MIAIAGAFLVIAATIYKIVGGHNSDLVWTIIMALVLIGVLFGTTIAF